MHRSITPRALGIAALIPSAASASAQRGGGPRDPMQEGLPLERTPTLTFATNVRRSTSVDVSPDGQQIVFDIRTARSLRCVMKNGRLCDANTLDELWPRQRKTPAFYWQTDESGTPVKANNETRIP